MTYSSQAVPVNGTKLVPPAKRAELLVDRNDIATRIGQHGSCRLVLVKAPAGYGKTSVLAQEYKRQHQGGVQAGWLSVDPADNDLARFLAHFIETLRREGSPAGLATLALLRSGVGISLDLLQSTLLNEMAALTAPCAVFIDDFHLITDEGVIGLVDALLRAPLPRLRLYIATRDATHLPVTRLRLHDDVLELGVEDLKFSTMEADELIRRQNGQGVAPDLTTMLQRRTEGWAAGLQFAAIALRDNVAAGEILPRGEGELVNVSRFLAEEVLRRQPAHIQEFLLATSILSRFDTTLCQAVTGATDARTVLDILEALNLFIFSLDDEHRWYRYHHSFSEFLQRQLLQYHPGRWAEYHRRASRCLAGQGLTIEAIEHALAAGEVEDAAQLLDGASSLLFARGQIATLRSWEARLPPETTARCVDLQLEMAWDFELRWRFGEAHGALDKARTALAAAQESLSVQQPARLAHLRSKLAHRELMLSLLSDLPAGAEALSLSWLQQFNGTDCFMQASTETSMMWSRRERYDVQGAAAATETLHELFLRGGAVYGTAFHNTIAGATLLAAGRLTQAEQVLARGRDCARQLHGDASALIAMPSMVLAELRYEQDGLDDARTLLARHFPQIRELGFVDNLIGGFITRAKLCFLDRDLDAAQNVLDEALHFANRYQFDRLRAHVIHEQVRQWMVLGHLQEAAAALPGGWSNDWVKRMDLAQPTTTANEMLMLAFARVQAEKGGDLDGVTTLRRWLAHVQQRHCERSTVRIALALYRITARQGQAGLARRHLIEALKAGAVAGFVRSFVDEGPLVLEQIAAVLATPGALSEREEQAVARLLHAARGGVQDDAATGTAATTGHAPSSIAGNSDVAAGLGLSRREIEILQLACDSMPNSEIGMALGLTESTVKWYWQRIYVKFGVHRRSRVIQRARAMGYLLPSAERH